MFRYDDVSLIEFRMLTFSQLKFENFLPTEWSAMRYSPSGFSNP